MDSFDFDMLEPVTLEKTLKYLRATPGPVIGDHPVSHHAEDAIRGDDWLGRALKAEGSFSLDIVQQKEEMVGLDDEAGESIPPSTFSKPFQPRVRDMLRRKCTWNKCDWTPTLQITFRQHTNEHCEVASELWFKGSRCVWQGCKSKEKFKTKKLYDRHLKNIHAEPLLCTEHGCNHKQPFRENHDLRRHYSTKHTAIKEYECPYNSCEVSPKTWARKDKWMKHIRGTEHQEDSLCPFLHCRAKQLSVGAEFSSREQIVEHFLKEHTPGESGGRSCGLGPCSRNIYGDRWSDEAMDQHLSDCHGLPRTSARRIANWMPYTSNILTTEMLQSILFKFTTTLDAEDWARDYHDCNICSQDSNGK